MPMEPNRQTALNPLPWAVWVLVVPLLAVEAVLQAGALGLAGGEAGAGWRILAVQRLGLSGAHLLHLAETGRLWGPELLRLPGFLLVHAGGLLAVLAAVLILALGKAVGEVLSGPALLVLVLTGAWAGALVWILVLASPYWMVGAYPAVFALLGAFCWLLWRRRLSAVANRRRFAALIVLLLVLRLGVGLWIGGGHDWLADIAAFAAGFGLCPLMVPGGTAALLERLRRR